MNRHWLVLVPLALLLTACGAEPGHVWTWPEVVHDAIEGLVLLGILWIVYVASGRRR